MIKSSVVHHDGKIRIQSQFLRSIKKYKNNNFAFSLSYGLESLASIIRRQNSKNPKKS